MSFWRVQEPFSFDKPILKAPRHESTEGTTVEASYVGLNSKGVKVVPAGLWLARVGTRGRFLPRVNVTSAASSGDTQIQVDLQQVLKAGDVLQLLEQKAVLTVGGTFVSGDYIYITYESNSAAYKVTDTAPADVAEGLANYISALRDSSVRAVASGSTVELYSVLGGPVTLSTNSSAGTVTVTSEYEQQGFIGEITGVNYETSTITVGTALSVDLPVGAKIGVPVDQIIGFHIHSVDFTYRDACILNAIHAAEAVYTDSFPYLDSAIRAQFTKITFD